MVDGLKWYDSVWLTTYFAARDVIARVAPHKLEEFVERLAVLRTDPSFRIKRMNGLFGSAQLAELKQTIGSVERQDLEMHELKRFGRFVVHDLPAISKIQESLVGDVSEWANEEVEASYNFLSLYTQKGICEPHLDSPSAKWTLDICIDQSKPWPIFVSQPIPWPDRLETAAEDWQEAVKSRPDLEFQCQTLHAGDAILFSGSSQWHYRNPIQREREKSFCDLIFLHFIPKGTRDLVKPKNWADIFGVPELSGVPGIADAR